MVSGLLAGISAIFLPLITSNLFFISLVVVLSIVLKWKMPIIKGVFGEWIVNTKIRQLGKDYIVFHDVYIPNDERGITQVDHIVTSPYGLFVIETKHYSGWIFGEEYKPYWTQVIYKRKEKIYNPIRQNYGHIQALLAYIGKHDTTDVHSIIAFSTSSTFKFKNGFSSAHVIQFPQLVKTIKSYNEPRISGEEVSDINGKLNSLVITDKDEKRRIKKEHLQSIKKAKSMQKPSTRITPVDHINRDKQSLQPTCPKCKGALTLKRGRYGQFLGCSNYPRCRHTEKSAAVQQQGI